ncbi:MAG TPA: NUDIX domain-containing protein [Flavobacteriaceae bacterium]|nr:NUDIX domain-containing protein [Flavobacteriaceae bacterium]
MYKVFVNDVPIILSTEKIEEEKYLSLPIKEANIKQIIKKVRKKKLKHVNLYHHKEHKLIKHFSKEIKPIEAGGGLVYNEKKEILFIFRKGKWDLPKGVTKKKEAIEDSAIREVEEETGVQNLKIIKPLPTTYHVFKRKGKYRLKVTHWFEMATNYSGALFPEHAEDITKAEWKNFEDSKQALRNSYANIRLLFPSQYLS